MSRLLLVEDEILVRMVAKEVLQEAGFEVLEAEDGENATRVLESLDHLDILVTDLRMPGRLDGVDVALHARGRFPQVPVIVTTGYVANSQERMKQLDPHPVLLEKPYRLDRLVSLARSLSVGVPTTPQDQLPPS